MTIEIFLRKILKWNKQVTHFRFCVSGMSGYSLYPFVCLPFLREKPGWGIDLRPLGGGCSRLFGGVGWALLKMIYTSNVWGDIIISLCIEINER